MKYIFFLIIPFLFIPSVYAETGKNFDTILNPDGTIKWTSHYERIKDINGNWVNHIINDKAAVFEYRSAGISFDFNKSDCSLKLYDENNSEIIPYYSSQLLINDIEIPSPTCNLINLIVNDDTVTFTAQRNQFDTHYEINDNSRIEWTYESALNTGLSKVFKIIERCIDCPIPTVDGDKLNYGYYNYDTKNEVHNSLKLIKDATCIPLSKELFCPDSSNITEIEFEQTINNNEKLVIDPEFSASPSFDAIASTATAAGAGCGAGNTITPSSILDVWTGLSSGGNCQRPAIEWDISSIPAGAKIFDVGIQYEITLVDAPLNCDYNSMEAQPSTLNAADLWTDIGDGTTFVSNNADCTSGGTKTLDLTSTGVTDLEDNLAVGWWGLGIKFNVEVKDGAHNHVRFDDDIELQVTYSAGDAVTDLSAADVRGTAVDLTWTTPTTSGTIKGYQINFTTPHSENVASIAKADTGSTSTSYTVSSLTGSTDYSFRVGVLYLSGGGNYSGNVLNVTTDFDPTADFTSGTFNITAQGTDIRNFKFTRTDTNLTTIQLDVIYPNTYDTSCTFSYKFAMINNTYTSIADTPINANEDKATFTFLDVDNEIIDVNCIDVNSNTTGKYLLTQSSFMILEQIQDFRNGTFGTAGNFGSLDLITVFAVIASMIGFNRVNESVGAILGIILIGALSVFQIISWEGTFTASLALVVLWAYTNTRKD